MYYIERQEEPLLKLEPVPRNGAQVLHVHVPLVVVPLPVGHDTQTFAQTPSQNCSG